MAADGRYGDQRVGHQSFKELVELSEDGLANQEIIHEKKILERFFDNLGAKPKMTPYKFEEVKKALEYGAVDVLIVSKEYDKTKAGELKTVAESTGATVEMVSTETEEGKQFSNLEGIGAIQRFEF